jgi:hypothetical protein
VIEASYLMKSDDTDLEESVEPTYTEQGEISKIKEGKKSGTTGTAKPKTIPGTNIPQFDPAQNLKDAVSGKGIGSKAGSIPIKNIQGFQY